MLTDKTLKLIVEYENYRFPVGHVHKFVNGFGAEYTTYGVWEEQGLFSEAEWFFVEEGVGLSNEEAISLEVVLSSGTNPEAFEVVSEFIQYVVNTPFFWEHSDSCVQMIGHKYFIDGIPRKTKPSGNPDPLVHLTHPASIREAAYQYRRLEVPLCSG